MLAGAFIAVLGAIFIIALVVWQRKKPPVERDYWETRTQPPSSYPPCVCPSCQTPIEADEVYCCHCGARL